MSIQRQPERPTRVLGSLRRRGFLLSAWPWRSLAYLAGTAVIATPVSIAMACVTLPWLALLGWAVSGHERGTSVTVPELVAAVLVGAVLVTTLGPALAMPLAALERRRLALIDARPISSGHRPPPPGLAAWLRARYTEPATWREVAYAAFMAFVVPVGYGIAALAVFLDLVLIASPWLAGDSANEISLGPARVITAGQAAPYAIAGVVLLPLVPYLFGLLASAHGAVARALLGDAGHAALREVSRSRARLVDAFEAERRRIERDLHDGAQHRLTSLTLQLGMARLDLPEGSAAAGPLATAHDQAKELMVVLRDLIHGIHPQVLSDLGLPAAIRELTGRSPVPVTLTVQSGLDQRPPERLESVAYFVVSEALTNVTRHAGAAHAQVDLSGTGGLLVVEVRDDGHGGADPDAGSGLTGLADRVAAVGGRLLLASPTGGPTLVRAELPWNR
ncbi:sensor histidine kinase [Rugosimonospora acidiphila]|uniref:histidine kinase n=1 Tax=Rugosimonospora acidiphila TaxID=556531 RepID=A0ABP9SE88_9ACTN